MLTDPEIKALYEVAYQHVKSELGYFPRPKLVIGVVPHKLRTHFYFENNTIYIHRNTRDAMYDSLKHELVHGYIEYCNIHHRGLFTVYCQKVGGNYTG